MKEYLSSLKKGKRLMDIGEISFSPLLFTSLLFTATKEWGTINHVTYKIIEKSNLHAVFYYLGALNSIYVHTFHYFFTLFLVIFICTVYKFPQQ